MTEIVPSEPPKESSSVSAPTFSELFRELPEKRKLPETEAEGVLAIGGTNERVKNGFFESVQAMNPDGYIIGVGAANAFTMLHTFPEGITPKGIVLADINPQTVAAGKLLLQTINESETAKKLEETYFQPNWADFHQRLSQLIENEQDHELKTQWMNTSEDTWKEVFSKITSTFSFPWEQIRSYEKEGENINVKGAILAKFDVLKDLVATGRISMEYADFTDFAFMQQVMTRLPEFADGTNLIYFSNIAEHITHRGKALENLEQLKKLNYYEQFSHTPPIYVDTTGPSQDYFLRANQTFPEFSRKDLVDPQYDALMRSMLGPDFDKK